MTNNTLTLNLSNLNIPYTVFETLIAISAVIGNGLVLIAFCSNKAIRKRTNYYLASLALADLLIGLLGLPFAILANVGLPRQLHSCLFTLSLLLTLCTISILNLTAVSADRYWTIVFSSSNYSLNLNKSAPTVIIAVCWIVGGMWGLMPLLGWYNKPADAFIECNFVTLIPLDYLVFIFFTTILAPAVLMTASYTHIYIVVRRHQLQQTRAEEQMNQTSERTHRREVKIAKKIISIVVFFLVCWFPIHFLNLVRAFLPSVNTPYVVIEIAIVVSHLNSALNPLLYAYLSRDIRKTITNLVWPCVSYAETSSSST